jgi:hypothetical protein
LEIALNEQRAGSEEHLLGQNLSPPSHSRAHLPESPDSSLPGDLPDLTPVTFMFQLNVFCETATNY